MADCLVVELLKPDDCSGWEWMLWEDIVDMDAGDRSLPIHNLICCDPTVHARFQSLARFRVWYGVAQ